MGPLRKFLKMGIMTKTEKKTINMDYQIIMSTPTILKMNMQWEPSRSPHMLGCTIYEDLFWSIHMLNIAKTCITNANFPTWDKQILQHSVLNYLLEQYCYYTYRHHRAHPQNMTNLTDWHNVTHQQISIFNICWFPFYPINVTTVESALQSCLALLSPLPLTIHMMTPP